EEPSIIFRNEVVNDGDFSAYMDQSDIVLIANKNAEASSGIINHVLARRKLVIAPEKGYFLEKLAVYNPNGLYSAQKPLKMILETCIDNIDELKNKVQKVNFDGAFLKTPVDFVRSIIKL